MANVKFTYLLFTFYFVLMAIATNAQQTLPNPPESFSENTDSLKRVAIEKSALLKGQIAEIAVKQEGVNREYRGWLSSFKMGIQFLNVSQDFEQNITKVGVLPSLGVSIQVDFERLFNTSSNIRSAKLEKVKAEQTYLLQQQSVELQIQELIADLELGIQQAQIRYQTYFTIVDQLTLVEERFKRGEIELNSYLNALTAVEQARESYFMVYFDIHKKKAHLALLTQTEPTLTKSIN
jgi:outer membrane protein TolC